MARVLVTGGAGFIGSHVVDACIREGHEVAVVDNFASGSPENLNTAAHFYEVDITTPNLGEVFARFKPELVCHLAAQADVRKSLQDPQFDTDVNVVGTVNVLDQCRMHNVGKLLFASTGGAIYGVPKQLPATEDLRPQPQSLYGTAKLCGEEYIHAYGRIFGLRYTILRLPNVYGPRQSPHGEAGVCSILIGKMLAGETPVLYGHGKPVRDYVYVLDVVDAFMRAMTKGDGGTYNIGSSKATTVQELFDTLSALIGFTGKAELKDLRQGEVEAITISNERAAADLGWSAKMPMQEGLKNTLEHIRTHG